MYSFVANQNQLHDLKETKIVIIKLKTYKLFVTINSVLSDEDSQDVQYDSVGMLPHKYMGTRYVNLNFV